METVTQHNPYSWHSNAAVYLGFLAETMPETQGICDFVHAIRAPLAAGEDFQPHLFNTLESSGPLELARWLELARHVRCVVTKQIEAQEVKHLAVRDMNKIEKRQYWAAHKRQQREQRKQDSLDDRSDERTGVNTEYLDKCVESGYKWDDFDGLTEEDVRYLRREYPGRFAFKGYA